MTVTADPTAWPDCGTERAYWRHVKRHETPDRACLDAHAEAARARRAAQRGRPARTPAPCGTEAAYRRHLYRGETPD